MSLAADLKVPILRDDHGVLRVGGTRVTLDSVLWAHRQGATPAEIQEQFPALSLADAHEAIAYYLRHQSELDQDLADQERVSREIEKRIRSQFPRKLSRASLQARLQR